MFYQTLLQETEKERAYLLAAPIIKRCFESDISLEDYTAFLGQAFHHVKHTVPLLMAAGSEITSEKEWLREAIAEYIEEEIGHQEWILNDLAACGVDKEMVRHSTPLFATEMMVSYAYDSIRRISPLAFFGMVLVLEGTSIALADAAAKQIGEKLALPKNAFSYLTSHGALDQDHIKFYEGLMNRIDDPSDQQVILHAARRFYILYGNIFREIDQSKAA